MRSDQKKILKVGIIGMGVGEAHIKGYESHKKCQVTALCDFNDTVLDNMKKKYPDKKVVSQAKDILDDADIDIVSIASYDNYHYEQIIRALNNDKHIFVEKPLCLEEKHARKLKNLLDKKSYLKISSNLILRMCPRFQALKKKIKNKEFGEIFCMEGDYNYGRLYKLTEGWRGKIDNYSVVLGGGVHIIDLMLWLTGDIIEEVQSYGNQISSAKSNFSNNDLTLSILKFRSGIVGKMSVNFGCVHPHFHNLIIYGTKATFINKLNYGRLFKSRDPKSDFERMEESYPGIHKGDLIFDFIDSIINNKDPLVTKDQIFQGISVCFAIDQAMGKGATKVNYI